MAEKLLEFVASRVFWGLALALAIGAMWLLSADTVGAWFGDDLGIPLLYIVVRMCLSPVCLVIASWLVMTGIR